MLIGTLLPIKKRKMRQGQPKSQASEYLAGYSMTFPERTTEEIEHIAQKCQRSSLPHTYITYV